MQKGQTKLSRDRRKIREIQFSDGRCLAVGADCHDIEAYDDHGPGEWMSWLAVKSRDGNIAQRAPARQVSVRY